MVRRPPWSLLIPVVLAVTAGAEEQPQPPPRLVNDLCPVMNDEPSSPLHEVQFRGVTVRFCCSDCKETFTEDPAPYLSRLPQLPVASLHPGPSEASFDARVERAAGRVERWAQPVLATLAALIAGFLIVRIVRQMRSRHAATRDSVPPLDELPGEAHPASGPRPRE